MNLIANPILQTTEFGAEHKLSRFSQMGIRSSRALGELNTIALVLHKISGHEASEN